MQAKEKAILWFLEWNDKHFVIPVYQRNYDRKKEQCKQLFDDLIEIKKNNFRTHFLWSIVSIYNDDGKDREYLIIDWQQRLTTISLLLLAIYKVLDRWELEWNINKDQIKDDYLINKYSHWDKKIKLKPVKNDRDNFSKLFEDSDDIDFDSRIKQNFDYFYNRIKEQEISIEDLFNAIKKLIIVEIELKRWEDDPQLIFESLNSTWLDLSEADKVRNFVLMKERAEKQELFYEKYWNKIEKNTNYNVSDFIRDYLTVKQRKIPNKNKVYNFFKEYIIINNKNIEEVLEEMYKFSKFYEIIINWNHNNPKVAKSLENIQKLEIVVSYPFLLEVFDTREKNVISDNELLEILQTIESFVFRRLICGVPTNALNKIFMILGREITNHPNYEKNYVAIFKYILWNKKWTQRFPTDEEFIQQLEFRDIYNFQSKNKLYLLENLENYNNNEIVNLERMIDEWKLSIEHIMPQTLTPRRKEELWQDFEKVYEKYLHTIWNITLTWYNSPMSNKSFVEKRDMEAWFKNSRLYLNKYLAEQTIWNEDKIKERYKILSEKSISIWSFPKTDYKPQKDETNTYSIWDEDFVATWNMIDSFSFFDTEYKVKSWRDFLEKVCWLLLDLDKYKFLNFAKNTIKTSFWWSIRVSSNEKDLMSPLKLADWIYVEKNLSAEWIIKTIRIILKVFDIEDDEVMFRIKSWEIL